VDLAAAVVGASCLRDGARRFAYLATPETHFAQRVQQCWIGGMRGGVLGGQVQRLRQFALSERSADEAGHCCARIWIGGKGCAVKALSVGELARRECVVRITGLGVVDGAAGDGELIRRRIRRWNAGASSLWRSALRKDRERKEKGRPEQQRLDDGQRTYTHEALRQPGKHSFGCGTIIHQVAGKLNQNSEGRERQEYDESCLKVVAAIQ
jgi:hypothetical protein